jgi:hypothetical protein
MNFMERRVIELTAGLHEETALNAALAQQLSDSQQQEKVLLNRLSDL